MRGVLDKLHFDLPLSFLVPNIQLLAVLVLLDEEDKLGALHRSQYSSNFVDLVFKLLALYLYLLLCLVQIVYEGQ